MEGIIAVIALVIFIGVAYFFGYKRAKDKYYRPPNVRRPSGGSGDSEHVL